MRTAISYAAAIGGVAMSLMLTGAAQSQALKTGYYAVDAAALTPTQAGHPYVKLTGMLYNISTAGQCFSTGINLPHRATITRVVVWYTGGTAIYPSIEFALVRHKMADGTGEQVAYAKLSNKSEPRKTQGLVPAAAHATVDNTQYVYGIDLCMAPDGASFYGARVAYTYTP